MQPSDLYLSFFHQQSEAIPFLSLVPTLYPDPCNHYCFLFLQRYTQSPTCLLCWSALLFARIFPGIYEPEGCSIWRNTTASKKIVSNANESINGSVLNALRRPQPRALPSSTPTIVAALKQARSPLASVAHRKQQPSIRPATPANLQEQHVTMQRNPTPPRPCPPNAPRDLSVSSPISKLPTR